MSAKPRGGPAPSSRRGFLGGALALFPALAGGALVGGWSPGGGGTALARPSPPSARDRRFLFILARGGWDPSYALAPGVSGVSGDPEGTTATVGGLPFVDSGMRPEVRRFFERHASRSALLHGFEVRSVSHERCKRILLTGSAGEDADDWPSLLAAAGAAESAMPHIVLSGPAYNATTAASVVRVGASGQLSEIVDGSVLSRLAPRRGPLSASAEEAADAYLEARLARHAGEVSGTRAVDLAAALGRTHSQARLVKGLDGLELAFEDAGLLTSVRQRVAPAITCFAEGFSRCAMVAHGGMFDIGWDSHSANEQQSGHFNLLFQDLNGILDDLQATRGLDGRPLLDNTCVVVLSEMGRAPVLNSEAGKDHWTFTSALLIGSGIAGGRVVGGYADGLMGRPTDPTDGTPTDAGIALTSAHLGATLLALGDVDPGDTPVIEALMA